MRGLRRRPGAERAGGERAEEAARRENGLDEGARSAPPAGRRQKKKGAGSRGYGRRSGRRTTINPRRPENIGRKKKEKRPPGHTYERQSERAATVFRPTRKRRVVAVPGQAELGGKRAGLAYPDVAVVVEGGHAALLALQLGRDGTPEEGGGFP